MRKKIYGTLGQLCGKIRANIMRILMNDLKRQKPTRWIIIKSKMLLYMYKKVAIVGFDLEGNAR